jgi:hypothetical protein
VTVTVGSEVRIVVIGAGDEDEEARFDICKYLALICCTRTVGSTSPDERVLS